MENFDTIYRSPSQIYHSALPFSPSSSWVRKCYNAELFGEVQVVKGLSDNWGTCLRTVQFSHETLALAHWKDTIAVGLATGDVVTLDGTTGSQKAVLSGHTDWVRSLAFSTDGTSLVSGSDDMTIKLWDMQTGGVVKTFHGHTTDIYSVSISADHAIIASGSHDNTIRLWDIQTGGCNHIMDQKEEVLHVKFSPIDPQHFTSVSGNHRVQQWDINGSHNNSSYNGSCFAFSLDGTQFLLCHGANIVVQNPNSGAIVAKFCIPDSPATGCCFSPDGRLIAISAYKAAYIWSIPGSNPRHVETFVGHSLKITSLVFSSPSSLITSSYDNSVKFWQIGTPGQDPVMGHPRPTPLNLAPIVSTTLQAKDGVTVSTDSDGMVTTWDISTGHCKTSLQTPAKNIHSDVRLVNGRLIVVWHANKKIHIWDVEKEELLNEFDTHLHHIYDIRISGDGSKVLCLHRRFIKAWSTETGEVVGRVEAETSYIQTSLIVNGSRVWAYSPFSQCCGGLDFGVRGSSPIQLPNMPSLHLSDTKLWDVGLFRIRDTTTGKVVLQLGGTSFTKVIDVQLDGWYFLVQYESGDVFILDFSHVLLW